MKSGILKLNMANVNSALVYGLLSGLLAVSLLVIKYGSVFGIDWKALVDAGVLGFITSIVKNLLTTNDGNFAGVVPVIPTISVSK